ncbi:Lactose permease [Ceratobasidium theobromae]|uniref:Lactose permease n=1 Tax=Ceratobasidium theobromae TaxID=1582974 RepID=A0A5N5QX52_9AGAM|nr:Lactose permease [Ceratobasidium theobromae]
MSFYDLVDDGPWWRNRGILFLNLYLLLALITSSANGFDSSMMNGLQIVPDWQYYFGNPTGSTLGMLNAVQNLGVLVALPMAPILSDKFGRKKSLLTGAFIMLGGVALQTTSTNIWHFVGSRGMIGLGLGFATNAAPLLITELAYPTQRGPITAIIGTTPHGTLVVLLLPGFASAPFACRELPGHGGSQSYVIIPETVNSYNLDRIPSVLQGLPSLIQVCLLWFVPESPRWLLSQNRDSEAIEILGKYHANGNPSDPLVVLEYQEIREALALEKEIAGEITYMSLFKSRGNLRRMRIIIALGFFSQWSGNGLFSYYLNEIFKTLGITRPEMKTLINGILQIWNLIMALGAAMFVDRLGRRTLFVISNAGMLCAFAIWTITAALYQLLGNTAAANANIALIFIFFSFYDIAYSPLLVAYTIEILPFNIRAKGFAVMNFSVCIALIVNQYVNPVALKAIGWKYALVYCGWLLFEFIFVFKYIIETKGRSLEQTAALFDGENHADALQQAGYDAARHTQIRTRDYEQYDYFSIYVDRGDDKMYEMRRVDNLHHEHGTNGRYAKIRKMRRPSENSIHADYASYRY